MATTGVLRGVQLHFADFGVSTCRIEIEHLEVVGLERLCCATIQRGVSERSEARQAFKRDYVCYHAGVLRRQPCAEM
ncbi:hypothetical protein D3C71_1324020 [compost metagenome]